MARTVKVGLEVDTRNYTRGVREAARTTTVLESAIDDVGSTAKDTGAVVERATDDMGDSIRSLAGDARRLDRQIDDTTRGIRELAREIAHASDEAQRADLSRRLTGEQGKLREQINLRKLIDFDSAGGMGAELAEQVSLSFAARLGPMIARAPMAGMNPAVLAIGAPLAAGAAITVGTAVAGAIVGGVGLGGVVGGLKLAAKDPAVQAAGAALGADLGGMLGRASSAFVPETLGAIDQVRRRTLAMEPDFRRAFSGAARYVAPLTDGLLDAAENAMPGVIDAIEHAGPVIDSLADGLRDLGDAAGDSLSDLAQYADEGARALDVLFFTMETGLRTTSNVIEGTAKLYGLAEKLGAVASGRGDRLAELVAADFAAKHSAEGFSGALDDVRDSARDAKRETADLIDVLTTLNGLQLSVNEAERGFQQAVDDAREAFDGKTRDFTGATEKGREYGEALDGIATKARDSAQAIFDQSGDVDAANTKIEEGRVALYNQARQYGRTDKEARDYVNSVLSIPERWNTKLSVEADAALREAKAVRSVIQSLRDRNITIGVRWQSNGDLKVPGGTIVKNERGGIYEHARTGAYQHAADGLVSLREAAVYSPASPARYAFAEPTTGGEAFVPRYGDRDRSLGILQQAARWYGASVTPWAAVGAGAPASVGGGGGGRQVIENHIHIGQEVVRVVRTEVSAHNRQVIRRAGAN